MIYLDNATASWPKPECVLYAIEDCLSLAGAKPGIGGRETIDSIAKVVDDARAEAAGLFGIADCKQIAFTANATTAINTALFGLVKPGWRIVTTACEHNAVARPLRRLEEMGATLTIVDCDSTGAVKMDELKAALQNGAEMVVAAHASNVTGAIQPIEQMILFAHSAGALFLLDSAQTAGIEEINAEVMGIDLMAFTGHKALQGIQGTGGLYVRKGINVDPQCYGDTKGRTESDAQPAFMPDKLESGTQNIPGIASLQAGIRYIRGLGIDIIREHERKLTQTLLDGLHDIAGVKCYGPKGNDRRTPIVSFTINGMDSSEVARRLSTEYDIICSAGLHGAPWIHRVEGIIATGTVRFSPGLFNTVGEMQDTLNAVRKIATL